MLTAEQAREKSMGSESIFKYKNKIKETFKQIYNDVIESCNEGFHFTDFDLTDFYLKKRRKRIFLFVNAKSGLQWHLLKFF